MGDEPRVAHTYLPQHPCGAASTQLSQLMTCPAPGSAARELRNLTKHRDVTWVTAGMLGATQNHPRDRPNLATK